MNCFDQFESGNLKGQTLTSKQLMTKPEVKQTQFQCLLPLTEEVQEELLSLVNSHNLSLQELKKRCQKEKKLSDLREKFVHLTNSKSWQDAKTKFPFHTESEKLEQFLSVKLKPSTPQVFSQFCAAAVLSVSTQEPVESTNISEINNCILIEVEDIRGVDPRMLTNKKFNGGSLFILYMDKVRIFEL